MFGYVFRNRYRSEPIFDSAYLKQCIVYIHNNPVKAEICNKPSEYKYSSYNEILTDKSILVSTSSIYYFFESKESFKNSHKKVKLDSYLDTTEEKEKYLQNEIESFLKKNEIDTSNFKNKSVELRPYVKNILEKDIMNKKELAERMHVSIYRLNKIFSD